MARKKASAPSEKAGFPETAISAVIDLLDLDSDLPISSLAAFQNSGETKSIREELTYQLNFIKSVYDRPAPSKSGITDAKLLEFAQSKRKEILAALKSVQSLRNEMPKHKEEVCSEAFKETTEHLLICELRNSDVPKDSPAPLRFWSQSCPFDAQVLSAYRSLKNIIETFDTVIEKGCDWNFPHGKGVQDCFIIGLCSIYKTFSKEKPIAWKNGYTHKISGTVISFLQILLENTHYSQATTNEALQRKLLRMRDEVQKNPAISHDDKKRWQMIWGDIWDDSNGF